MVTSPWRERRQVWREKRKVRIFGKEKCKLIANCANFWEGKCKFIANLSATTLADPGFQWGGGAKWKTWIWKVSRSETAVRSTAGGLGGGGRCKPPEGSGAAPQKILKIRRFSLTKWPFLTSFNEHESCRSETMFYQSRRALPISSLRLAEHSVEMSLVNTVKLSRSVQWPRLNLRQGFQNQCWTPKVVHLRQAQFGHRCAHFESPAQACLSRCLNLDKSPSRNFALLGQSRG